jgi:hypothetical protein
MGDDALLPGVPLRRAPCASCWVAKVAFGSSVYIPESVLDVPDTVVRGTLGLVDLAYASRSLQMQMWCPSN